MDYKLDKPVHAETGTVKYQCSVEWRNGTFLADEPVRSGGGDKGPDPYTLLLSSLATCTLITLRMYIDRKGWSIPALKVNTNFFQEIQGEQMITFYRQGYFLPGTCSAGTDGSPAADRAGLSCFQNTGR